MSDEEEKPSQEEPENRQNDNDKYRTLLLNRLKLNKDYEGMELEKEPTLTLEALYRAEEIKKNAETKKTLNPKGGTFNIVPIQHIKKNEEKALEKKQNQKTADPNFNVFEVFYPQYQHVDKMCKFNEKCEILSLRIHPSNKHPEWQVS